MTAPIEVLTDTILTLVDLVVIVADIRRVKADLTPQIKEAQSELEETPEYKSLHELKNRLSDLKELEKVYRERLNSKALNVSMREDTRKPHPAVEIKKTVKNVYEQVDAISWAAKAEQFQLLSFVR